MAFHSRVVSLACAGLAALLPASAAALTVDNTAPITAANATAYTVLGTGCVGPINVTLTVAMQNYTFGPLTCTGSGDYSGDLDLSSVPDGAVLLGVDDGSATASTNVIKDTVCNVPVISTPAESAQVAAGTVNFAGTADPGATVHVEYWDDSDSDWYELFSLQADGTGAWAQTASMVGGAVEIRAFATDQYSNTGNSSASRHFSVVGLPRVKFDGVPGINSSNQTTWHVLGICTSGLTVDITIGGTLMLTAPCSGGEFQASNIDVSQFADTLTLAVQAQQTNIAGTTVVSRTVVKDTVTATPVITSPVSGSTVGTSVAVTADVEAWSDVTVTFDGDSGTAISVTVGGDGALSVSATLSVGSHSVVVAVTDPFGNSNQASVSFTVNAGSPPAVALGTLSAITQANAMAYAVTGTCTTSAGNVGVLIGGSAAASVSCSGGSFSATVNASGLADGASVSVYAAQMNGAGTGAALDYVVKDTAVSTPVITSPAQNSTPGSVSSIVGTGDAGDAITVTESMSTLCTATVDSGGGWSCAVTLSAGPHTIVATEVDAYSNAASSSTRTFTIVIVNPPVVALNTPGPITGSNKTSYAVSGTCTSGSGNVALSLTISGGATTGQTTCTAGVFSTVMNASLIADSTHVDVAASQTNSAGTGSDTRVTVKDTVALAPVIQTPVANASVGVSHTISGISENSASVTVKDGTMVLCTVTASSVGAWSCPGQNTLGAHSITAAQTDAVGNVSAFSAATVYTAIAPPAVTLDTLATINAANKSAFSVSGQCTTAAGTVSVSVGSAMGSASCTGGQFSASINAASLSDGPSIAVTASQTNGAGTGSDSANTTKDTVVAPPVITVPTAGATVAVHPTISGTSEAGAVVTVHDASSTQVCLTTANGTGAWTCTSSLAAGAATVTAVQVDAAGNLSTASAARSFTVAGPPVVALSMPTVINAANAAAYAVTGSCTSGAGMVSVSAGTVNGSGPCSGSQFSVALDVSGLSDGPSIALGATQTNISGTGSDTATARKDTISLAPVVSTPAASAVLAANPGVSGTAEALAAITVREGTNLVCMTVAGPGGTWSCSTTLGVGSHGITATQTDVAGNTSSPSATQSFTIVSAPVVALSPLSPMNGANASAFPVAGTCTTGSGNVSITIGSASGLAPCAAGAFSGTVNVTAIADGSSIAVSVAQTNVAGTGTDSKNTSKDTIALPPVIRGPAGGASVSTAHNVSGTAEASASITVKEGSTTLCTVSSNGITGAWACPGPTALGSHSVTATQTDPAGNVSSASAVVTYTVVATPAVVITSPAVISSTNAAAYAVSGTCTIAAGTVTVSVAAVSGTTACTSAAYTITLNVSSVADGQSVTITAAQTNAAGVGSDSRTVVKDTAASAPVFTAPAANANVAANPSISGTAEAGAAVTVRSGSNTVCTATASPMGAWTCATTFGAGLHSVTATQVDAVGNTSAASAALSFTVVGAPTVTLAAPGLINAANAGTYSVSGSCTSGAGAVTVAVGSVMSAATCSSGSFVATLNVSSLGDGSTIVVTATQANVAGSGSDSRNTRKDTVALAPTIAAPLAGNSVGPTPTVRGNGEVGSTVTVKEGTATVCTAVTSNTGLWTCAPTLTAGSHTISARQVDTANNASASSATVTFTVVTTPAVILDAPPVINKANAMAYPVAGVCIVNAGTVSVSVGTVMGNATCTAARFSTTLNVSGISDGNSIAVHASQMNMAGTGNDSKTAIKDTTVAAPVIGAPAMGATVASNPVISGTSEASASVTVREGTATVCTAQANTSGMWDCASPWSSGTHSIAATQTDVAGNVSLASNTITFTVATVPTVTLDMPTVITASNQRAFAISGQCSSGGGTVTVIVGPQGGSATGSAPCTGGMFSAMLDVSNVSDAASVSIDATQTNVAGMGVDTRSTLKDTVAAAPVITAPAAGAMVAMNPSISGSGEAGATVRVVEGTTSVCSATVSMAGSWTCVSTLSFGPHSVSASQVDVVGNASSASAARPFVVTTTPVLTLMAATINASNASDYTVRGTCSVESALVEVSVGTVSASAVCTNAMFVAMAIDASALPDGAAVTVTARQSNAAGPGSASTTVLKDTVAPAAPVITTPASASTVPSVTEIAGSSEAGSHVTVTLDGNLLGTVTADSSGAWALAPASMVALGDHLVSATAHDTAGNPSGRSMDVAFTVAAPIPLAITAPLNGATLPPDVAVTVTGTAPAGTALTARLDGQAVGSGSATSAGTWQFTVAAANVVPGAHTLIVASSTDSATISITVSDRPMEMMMDMPMDPPPKKMCASSPAGFSVLMLLVVGLLRRRR